MIHVFHGIFGSPKDFSFLETEDVALYDLYEMTSFPEVKPDDTLIGYSLGGRISLEIADTINFNFKKLVLINAHPGLSTEEERIDRKILEQTIQKNLKTKDLPDFFSWWNSLEIFQSDAPIRCDLKRFQKSFDLFNQYLLSEQKNYLPSLQKNIEKVLLIIGSDDKKYNALASDIFIPSGLKVKKIKGGHRLFQHPDELQELLLSEKIL